MHVRQDVASFLGFTLVLRTIQTASARQSGRGVSQTPRLPEGRLADGIWQTASARCRLPDEDV